MNSPHVPDDADTMLVLLDGLSGGDGSAAIYAQERHGQHEIVNSDVIPTKMSGRAEHDLIALGFTLGEQVGGDPMFRRATLPEGWSRQGTEHAMHSKIVDTLGRPRVNIFYKAAFYDRRADLMINSVYGYVTECVYEGTTPVLDEVWATRAAVLEALDSDRADQVRYLEMYEGYHSEHGDTKAARIRKTIAPIDALRASLDEQEAAR